MELLRHAWHLLRLTEKLLLGASLVVLGGCAINSWQLSGQQTYEKIVLREPSHATLIKWQDDGELMVDVTGAVRHPGILKLSSSARVQDAVRQAGGLLPDASTADLNLAAPLQDGQQVRVAAKGDKSTFTQSTFDEKLIDINHASAAELQRLPGVGPVLAQRIMEFRRTHGSFRSLEELDGVKGIGRKRLEKWRPLIIFR